MRASVILKLNLICRKCFRKTEGGWTLTFRESNPKLYPALIIAVLVFPRFFFFFCCYVEIFFCVYLPQQTNAYFKIRRFPLELKRPQITWRSFFITPVGGKTNWLWTNHDVRLQPLSQEEAGQSQTASRLTRSDPLQSSLPL